MVIRLADQGSISEHLSSGWFGFVWGVVGVVVGWAFTAGRMSNRVTVMEGKLDTQEENRGKDLAALWTKLEDSNHNERYLTFERHEHICSRTQNAVSIKLDNIVLKQDETSLRSDEQFKEISTRMRAVETCIVEATAQIAQLNTRV